jgi:N,N'-diacetyllegionaminate synthase
MVASSKLPLVISLGIGFEMDHLNKIFDIASKYGNKLSFMYANNAYPTPIEDAGIAIVRQLAQDTKYGWGLSDHTKSTLTPALAVAAGATIIEKHFTLSKRLPGPDHPFALEPNELKEMIQHIKFAERSVIKQSLDGISNSEQAFKQAMRSVVAKKPIQAGETFTLDNITTKRPFLEGNIPASKFEHVLGNKSTKSYNEDDFI